MSEEYRLDHSKLKQLADVITISDCLRNAQSSVMEHSTSHYTVNDIQLKNNNNSSDEVSGVKCNKVIQPVVIVICGTFNPLHNAHITLYEVAKQRLLQNESLQFSFEKEHTTVKTNHSTLENNDNTSTTEAVDVDANRDVEYVVLGGFISPVSDGYNKPGRAPFAKRLSIIRAGLQKHNELNVDCWEGLQPTYTRTYYVLDHLQSEIRAWYTANEPELVLALEQRHVKINVIMACGADLALSFFTPHCWTVSLLRKLLDSFQLIIVTRDSTSEDEIRRRAGAYRLHEIEDVHGSIIINNNNINNNSNTTKSDVYETWLDISAYTFMYTSFPVEDNTSSTRIREKIRNVFAQIHQSTSSTNSYQIALETARQAIAPFVPHDAIDTIISVYAPVNDDDVDESNGTENSQNTNKNKV